MWMGLVTLTNYLHLRPKISRQLWVSGPTPTTVLENTKYWFFGLDFIDIEIRVKFRYCECVNTNFKGCYEETCIQHHIVYIVGCKRLVRMTWDICNDQKYIFKNLQHSLKKWMHTLTFIAKGFENWTILIFYFDNLILSNLKQTNLLFLYQLVV